MKSSWGYLGGTVVSPVRTFQTLRSDPKKVSKGFKVIFLMGVLYAVTAALLAGGGALITAPALLAVSAENYYFVEMFFALPIVTAGWILAAGWVSLVSHSGRSEGTFEDAAAALGFALAVPMFFIWIPETVFAVLLLLGMRQEEFMDLTARTGFLTIFGWAYHIVAAAWMLALIILAVGIGQRLSWWKAVVVGISTTVLFIAVLLLFIR